MKGIERDLKGQRRIASYGGHIIAGVLRLRNEPAALESPL